MADDPKVRFNWVRSSHFRVIHADGAYGGITPYGNVFFSLYSDHPALPVSTVHSLTDEGALGPELSGEKKLQDGVERELEVSVVMTLDTARALQRWLDERVKVLEALQPSVAQQVDKSQESEVKK